MLQDKNVVDFEKVIQLIRIIEKNKFSVKKISKEEVFETINESDAENEDIKLEDIINKIELKNEEEVKSKLNWEYKDIELSKIEGKSSVSKIKQANSREDINEFKKLMQERFSTLIVGVTFGMRKMISTMVFLPFCNSTGIFTAS